MAAANRIINLPTGAAPDAANERVTLFANFLERDFKENADQQNLKLLLQKKEKRLVVDIDDLRSYDASLADNLLRLPMDYFPAFDKALRDCVMSAADAPKPHLLEDVVYYIGLRGSFGDHHVNPRSLNASYLGKIIAMEGIITRCSLVRPKMAKSVHYCEKTMMFHTREYRDATSLGDAIPTGSTYPTQDESGNPLTTEFGLCTFRDHQMVSIQEMPERAPPGQLPRSIEVILEDDLVDSCKPGDRVQLVGVYRSVGSNNSSGSATFRTLILCKTMRLLDKEIAAPTLSDLDILQIRKIAQRSYVTDLLAQSLAPSIFGHPFVKKAILMLLLGGIERNLLNGTHIRGDINMLLLGDPSTAKSQFLRFVIKIAPLAIATTGRGSSGVGLTAAVTQDKETGDRRLEAGAMVLADRGIVCIDEFDKMNDSDRVAIHEVMEQQTITIAKAGIHTSLNARCSMLAAANPTYGQYDESLEPHRNIRLPDSLLSRFDLLFVILDKTDEAMDRRLSSHVLEMHRYLPPGAVVGRPIPESTADYWLRTILDETASATANNAASSNGNNNTLSSSNTAVFAKSGRRRSEDILTLQFLKKYIHYAKSRMRPVLSEEASQVIVEAYAALRNEKGNEDGTRRTLPVTARTLETLIRLATANAKARLSQRVEEVDAEAANELLRFALFKEFRKKPRKINADRKRKKLTSSQDGVDDGDEDSSSDVDDDDNGTAEAGPGVGSAGDSAPVSSAAPQHGSQMDIDDGPLLAPSATANMSDLIDGSSQPNTPLASPVAGGELEEFMARLDALFQELGTVTMEQLREKINRPVRYAGEESAHAAMRFTSAQITFCLRAIEGKGHIFFDSGSSTLYRM